MVYQHGLRHEETASFCIMPKHKNISCAITAQTADHSKEHKLKQKVPGVAESEDTVYGCSEPGSS